MTNAVESMAPGVDAESRASLRALPPHAATVDFQRDVVALLGLPFDVTDMRAAVAHVRASALGGRPCMVSTPNLNFVITARTDAAFRDSVADSDMSLVDGMPLVWISRLLGLPIRERVAGAGLFEALSAQPAVPPLDVFFFGGPEGAAAAAHRRLNERAGGLCSVGFDPAGFGSVEEMSGQDRIDRINASGAHFVVAALGARKGQAWLQRNRTRLAAPVLCHLGAVVGFTAGELRRAPRWMQRAGMEWLWRVKEEPALWRRYAGDGLAFLRLLVSTVLPLWLAGRAGPPSPDAFARASVTADTDGPVFRLVLAGAFGRDNLQPVRTALDRAARASQPLRLRLRDVTFIDSAFVGLLMISVRAFAAGFEIVDASPAVRRTLRHHLADHLLQPRHPA